MPVHGLVLDGTGPVSHPAGNAAITCGHPEEDPLTAPATRHADVLLSLKRQHTGASAKLAGQIIACAGAVREDLMHARPAGAAARQIAVLAGELLVELAKLAATERFAAWTREPAA
jgi:hypothetical protein